MFDNRQTIGIDLAIVTNEPFPFGMAATNRIISYTKEICKTNTSVKVYIAKPTELNNQILNLEFEGIHQDIQFKYVHNKTKWEESNNYLKKIIIIIKGLYLLF